MNYIFLDIDGVLNSEGFLTPYRKDDDINPENVKRLAELVHKYDCKIILSSSWCNHFGEEGIIPCANDTIRLVNILAEYDLKLSDRLPYYTGCPNYYGDRWWRPPMICEYIKTHFDYEKDNWVILDDDGKPMIEHCYPRDLQLIKPHLVQTEFYCGDGFDDEALKKACEIFDNKPTIVIE